MTMNAFENLADRQISAPRKARMRAAEKRAARKASEEREQLSAAWRRWRDERREKLLVGSYGDSFRSLIDFLESLTLESGAALIVAIETGPWKHADADTRFEALTLIDSAIVELRERHNLPPFDDPLPGDPPVVFQIICEALS